MFVTKKKYLAELDRTEIIVKRFNAEHAEHVRLREVLTEKDKMCEFQSIELDKKGEEIDQLNQKVECLEKTLAMRNEQINLFKECIANKKGNLVKANLLEIFDSIFK